MISAKDVTSELTALQETPSWSSKQLICSGTVEKWKIASILHPWKMGGEVNFSPLFTIFLPCHCQAAHFKTS